MAQPPEVATKIRQHDNEFDEVYHRLDALRDEQKSQRGQLVLIQENQRRHGERLEVIDSRLDKMNGSLDTITGLLRQRLEQN